MTLGPGTWGGSIISENVSAKHMMNVKTLAFETRPVNQGNSVNSFDSSDAPGAKFSSPAGSNFTEQIEDRLRARAGNLNTGLGESPFKKESKDVKKGVVYGTGISETEIQRIINEFNK
jgi:hypothetical protein